MFARFRLLRAHVDFPGLNIDSSPGILCPRFVNNDSDLFVLFARPVWSVFIRPESYLWRLRRKERGRGSGGETGKEGKREGNGERGGEGRKESERDGLRDRPTDRDSETERREERDKIHIFDLVHVRGC